LKKLIDSSVALKNSQVVMIPAFGPVHAPHLKVPDLQYIMGESPLLDKMIKANYKVISGSKNRPMTCPNLRRLVQQSLEDIFQYRTNPERVFKAGLSLLHRDQEIHLFVLGNTSYLPSFKHMLQKERLRVISESNDPSEENIEGHIMSQSIAIVGMSGRFPGSDTVEELWTSIMEQNEYHKKASSHEHE
jgi:hypothetical protein